MLLFWLAEIWSQVGVRVCATNLMRQIINLGLFFFCPPFDFWEDARWYLGSAQNYLRELEEKVGNTTLCYFGKLESDFSFP